MNLLEFRKLTKKKSKYHSEKSGEYDSRREHQRALLLELMEKKGIILDLRKQVRYELAPAQYVQGFNGKPVCVRRAISYVADFVYICDGIEIVEDSKGFKTKEYKHKKILMKQIFGIDILET